MAQSISQEAIVNTGLPGATAASRYAGATTSGAPTTGTFAVGDFVVDQTGAMYVCTVAGTPGTWQLSGVSINENIAGKNFVINGGMDIWQRGTSFSTSSGNIYTADRFCFTSGGNATTVSQVTSGLTGFQYAHRVQRNSGTSGTAGMYLAESLETKNSIPMAGQTVTWSFWARAGANYSQSGSTLYVQLVTGTGTDQNVLVSYTGQASPINTVVGITTSWQKFTLTTPIASTVTEIAPLWAQIPTGTAGANDYFDITGVQLEIAPQATPFSRAGGSIGGELALCQRYYQRFSSAYQYAIVVPGMFGQSSTGGQLNFLYPVTMRTIPSSIDFSNLAWYGGGGGPTSISNVVINGSYITSQGANLTVTSTGLTNGSYYAIIQSATGSAYLGLSAEL